MMLNQSAKILINFVILFKTSTKIVIILIIALELFVAKIRTANRTPQNGIAND